MITSLQNFAHLPIDWELSPEMAVTLYLEWGNNNWHGTHPPVRGKSDIAYYFVVDTWQPQEPYIRLVKRNSEAAEDLLSIPLPKESLPEFKLEYGDLKGIFEPTPAIKAWLKEILYGQKN